MKPEFSDEVRACSSKAFGNGFAELTPPLTLNNIIGCAKFDLGPDFFLLKRFGAISC